MLEEVLWILHTSYLLGKSAPSETKRKVINLNKNRPVADIQALGLKVYPKIRIQR